MKVWPGVSTGLALLAALGAVRADAASPSTGTVYGVVKLHGASIASRDIHIMVRPLVEPGERGQLAGRPANGADQLGELATRVARISAVRDDPTALDFSIRDVIPGVPYRLSLRFTGDVGRVVWRVSDLGVVQLPVERNVPPAPVQIHGFVVTSEIEIARPLPDGTVRFVGADALDFNDPAAVRTLRWRTRTPGAGRARLVISTEPLRVPLGGRPPNPCDVTGVLFSTDFDVQSDGWTSLPSINFHDIVFGVRRGEVALPGADARTVRRLQAGAGLYLRAIPLDADGAPLCGADEHGVTGMAVVGNGLQVVQQAIDLAEAPIKMAEALYQPPNVSVHPKQDEVCYRTTTEHVVDPAKVNLFNLGFPNPQYNLYEHYLWTSGKISPGATAPAGTFFCVYNGPSDSSWFDDFVGSVFDLVTGFVDAISQMVNFASHLMDQVKAAVVDVAASALSALPPPVPDCDDICKTALEAGLEAGMVAMGVPPSLPNFDQLMQGGVNYLADMAAEEVGVPPLVAEKLAAEGQKFVETTIAEMKNKQAIPGLPTWVKPDIGLTPAVLTLYLSGPGFDLGVAPGLIRSYDSIFLGSGLVKLPRQFGATPPLVMPMALQPNLEGLPTVPSCSGGLVQVCMSDYYIALKNKEHWVNQRLNNGCAQFYATIVAPAPALIYKLFSANVQADTTPFPFWDGFANCVP